MPTWYTEPVMYGEMVSAKDYILRCARSIDYLAYMRDELYIQRLSRNGD